METLSDVSSGEDRYRPSFFELAAQEQLRDLLQPVVRYLLSVLATRYPRYFLRFSNKHEETYLTLMFFVERHYLKTMGGSFAENFYGMKRRRRPGVSSERAQSAVELFTDHEKLRKRELRWSLLFLIGIPYLRTRLDDLHEQMGGASDGDLFGDRPQAVSNGSPQPRTFVERIRTRLALIFKLLWPRLTKAYEYVLLGYNVAYLFDKTPYYRPWLHWLGVDLRRMSDQDYRKAEAAQAALRTLPFSADPSTGLRPTTVQTVLHILKMAPQLLLSGLKVALPASIFLFKFLEWWSSSSYARNLLTGSTSSAGGTAGAAAPALRAPSTRIPAHPDGVLGKDGLGALPVGTCPICKKAVTNPTALPTGYVGDYRCLFDYVEKEGRCPVTRLKVAPGDLRKING